jgi:hypothetical protein
MIIIKSVNLLYFYIIKILLFSLNTFFSQKVNYFFLKKLEKTINYNRRINKLHYL